MYGIQMACTFFFCDLKNTIFENVDNIHKKNILKKEYWIFYNTMGFILKSSHYSEQYMLI